VIHFKRAWPFGRWRRRRWRLARGEWRSEVRTRTSAPPDPRELDFQTVRDSVGIRRMQTRGRQRRDTAVAKSTVSVLQYIIWTTTQSADSLFPSTAIMPAVSVHHVFILNFLLFFFVILIFNMLCNLRLIFCYYLNINKIKMYSHIFFSFLPHKYIFIFYWVPNQK